MERLYVCAFSSGVIKVGRTKRLKQRIASHRSAGTCFGVTLTAHYATASASDRVAAERSLIRRCAAAAAAIHHNEWFTGLQFDDVCRWADGCAAEPRVETSALPRFQAYLQEAHGRAASLAANIKSSPAYVYQLATKRRGISAQMAVRIERATEGSVRRQDLRDDWAAIWPELIDAEGSARSEAAPAAAATATREAA